jgi:tetratricopeptide (TPR) repeat protein
MDVIVTPAPSSAGRFFRRIDWAAFWTATLASFAVYFLTLGPSVTLEDSGELAVAGDYLGVPHPPGYPLWTMCAWVFARVFGWVTFRGQPTPAWSIALLSAVFGALAAGITAMLITRSSADMLRDTRGRLHRAHESREGLLCWAGGVAGSLIFAFSPVMWSQATIVEVYTLNAFFLMLVMLLTYRWMRRPTEKLLWLTAFVFGLGLTNYQVLLLAALPLVVVIFLRDIALFRDFLLTLIPFLLTALVLKLGALPSQPGFGKHVMQTGELFYPRNWLCVAGVALFGATLLLAVVLQARRCFDGAAGAGKGPAATAVLGGGFAAGCLLLFLSVAASSRGTALPPGAPLVEPAIYVRVATLVLAAAGLCVLGALRGGDDWRDPWRWGSLAGAGVVLLILGGVIDAVPAAPAPPGAGAGDVFFSWGGHTALFALALLLLIGLGLTTPRGVYFGAAVLVVEVALLGLMRKGALLGLMHPSTWWFWAPAGLNFLFLALAWITLPHGRTVALTALAAELGVSFYVYMPIVSDLRNPPMNWGYPRTWEGFKHALTRGQYEKIVPTDIFSARFVQQIGSYFTDLRTQFTLLLAPLGFLPFAAWQMRPPRVRRAWRLPAALAAAALACLLWGIDHWVAAEAISSGQAAWLRGAALALLAAGLALALTEGLKPFHVALGIFAATVVFVVLGHIGAIEHLFDTSRVDKLLMAGLLLLGGAGGALLVIGQMDEVAGGILAAGGRSERLTLGLTLLGLMAGVLAVCFKGFLAVFPLWRARLAGLPPPSPAAVPTPGTAPAAALAALLVVALLFGALPWLRRELKARRDLEFSLDAVSQQWMIATVAAFLMMSVLLIVLANPRGDLQDAFIQKVKFISSHGLFAVWIGYGLVFALATADTVVCALAGRRRAGAAETPGGRRAGGGWTGLPTGAAVVLTLALALIPIHQNYTNERLVFELGGAEQNGHDYGWQFGNYQLRGAEAIDEELAPGEEPLPNPLYPPAMSRGAIFFGGTDPGRFVPTYMIYSAKVREDVFLITQNALADNTYMSVMRDLYGDRIWIPTPDDSARAFQIYVEEVQSGKRPRNADLVIENGRVQVSGALGVMEINGILCEMIFEHNKARHDFYVEESYVIPWMYPYLTPHGLIMKLNAEKTGIAPRHINDDLDFWDWYVRRLTRDERYRRDLVAQKSFSKLRSAIGGLYAARGLLREAELAFQEALVLYRVSPEATFRLIQEVLLRQRRYDEAIALIDSFIAEDPNNERGPEFRRFIVGIREREQRIRELSAKIPPGRNPDVATSLELARCYRDLGSTDVAARLLLPQLDNPELTSREAYELALMLDALGSRAGAVRAMDMVMTNLPPDASPEMLLAAARVYANARETKKMAEPLRLYLRLRPDDWQGWLDLATLHAIEQDLAGARGALRRALELGGEEARRLIEGHPQLRRLAEPPQRPAAGAALPDLGLGGW